MVLWRPVLETTVAKVSIVIAAHFLPGEFLSIQESDFKVYINLQCQRHILDAVKTSSTFQYEKSLNLVGIGLEVAKCRTAGRLFAPLDRMVHHYYRFRILLLVPLDFLDDNRNPLPNRLG